ncbi:MAG: hypothetical protein ABI895_25655 [Deltaproteobacteria bacterium]
MRIPPLTNETPLPWALAVTLALAACGGSDDRALFSELDRLRVLAVRSEPADLAVGEVATLSALTYEPDQRELEYAWSWCPSRQELADGGACRIEEEDLRRAWDTLDTGRELPPYDLGSNREAGLTNVFGADVLSPLCAALSAEKADPEQAALSCLLDLGVSVSLSVRSPEQELTAVKRLVLLEGDIDASERNQNPAPTGELLVRDVQEDRLIEEGGSLVADHEYDLRLVLDESLSEPFLPSAPAGAGMGESRRETLVMSWFVTEGSFPSADGFGDGGGPLGDGGGERTTFVDGQNDFGALLVNRWRLPRRLDSSEATLVLVLRDERGGVGWAEHRYALGASE